MPSISAKDLKRLLLELVEGDRELRYALMGLLGFREVLERITRLEERQQKLEERFARLEERFAQLEERVARLEERFAKLEERFAELAERQQKLEERLASLEERMLRVEEAITGLQRTLATVAHRFGVLSEAAFREALAGILEEFFGAKAYRWVVYDEKGVVYGRPAQVEVDVVVRDKTHILVEVKSRADTGDVLELTRIARLYEEKEGVKPQLAIVAGFVDHRARKLAEKLGVRIYTYLGGGEEATL